MICVPVEISYCFMRIPRIETLQAAFTVQDAFGRIHQEQIVPIAAYRGPLSDAIKKSKHLFAKASELCHARPLQILFELISDPSAHIVRQAT